MVVQIIVGSKGDIGVLAAMACVFWTAGVAVFKRRDICTL